MKGSPRRRIVSTVLTDGRPYFSTTSRAVSNILALLVFRQAADHLVFKTRVGNNYLLQRVATCQIALFVFSIPHLWYAKFNLLEFVHNLYMKND